MDIASLIDELRNGKHEMYPVATEADVRQTEDALGVKLPESYKQFVTRFSNGCYVYTLQEVSAVGDGNAQICAIQGIRPNNPDPDRVIPLREGGETTYKHLVPFGLDHNANEWCFITNEYDASGECPVAYLDTEGMKLYGKQASFASWLAILVREQDEVIRTLYDEDIIDDELMLG